MDEAKLSRVAERPHQQNVQSLPPGFKFHPTDEELISYYLAMKTTLGSSVYDINGNFSCRSVDAISVLDVNKHDTWEIPDKVQKMAEKEWYFFCQKDRKYPTGSRTNRATRSGYWKATGRDKEVVFMSAKSNGSSLCHRNEVEVRRNAPRVVIGMRKTLVFYEGRAPKGQRSSWVMHEYRLHGQMQRKLHSSKGQEWVLCRLHLKKKLKQNASAKPNSCCAVPSPVYDGHMHHDMKQNEEEKDAGKVTSPLSTPLYGGAVQGIIESDMAHLRQAKTATMATDRNCVPAIQAIDTVGDTSTIISCSTDTFSIDVQHLPRFPSDLESIWLTTSPYLV